MGKEVWRRLFASATVFAIMFLIAIPAAIAQVNDSEIDTGSEDGGDGASVRGRDGNSTDGADDIVSATAAASPSPTPSPSPAAKAAKTAAAKTTTTSTPITVTGPVIPDIAPLEVLTGGAEAPAAPAKSGNAGGGIGSDTNPVAGGTSSGAPGGTVGADDPPAAAPTAKDDVAAIARTGGRPLLALAIVALLAVLGVMLRKDDPLSD